MIRRSLAADAWTVRAVGNGAGDGAGSGAGDGAANGSGTRAGSGAGDGATLAAEGAPHPERRVPDAVGARAFPATVPGCVHADLQAAGVLADTDLAQGELHQEWVGWTDWQWTCTFDVPAELIAHARRDLVLDGLDTIAHVHLNGALVGAAANQFHPHRMDVRSALRAGANELRVTIRAPVAWVREQERALGTRPVNGDWTPYPFVRKSACSFGWDWGPRAPSSGIGGAWIEAWNDARIAEVRPLVTTASEASATVDVHVRVERATDAPRGELEIAVELEGPDGRVVRAHEALESHSCVVRLSIDRPALWWPRGMGAQCLYDLRVHLVPAHGAATPLASARRRIGLRRVELDTSPDEHGTRFAIKVNGSHVYCIGANWIPASLHPATAPRERTTRLLELACEANINMLRVWGGGVYEPEHFYEQCDALGIMVWQDFMFACATYPEDAPFPALVECEARAQIARLCSHPCIVLWCGGNENVIAWQAWGFRDRLAPGQSWGRRYWLELLPLLCAQLDPTRAYWPDSPWSGSLELNANDPDRGDRHTWDLKVEEYRSMVPRFVSEFGHQSPPNLCTLREALGDDELRVHGAELARRQRAGGGDAAQYDAPLDAHFAPATTFGEWLYHAHLLQARAMALAITWLRANQPRNMGSMFWQWNDVWSGPSWSAVDVKLRPKPVWHAVQRAARPRMVSIEPLGGSEAPRAGSHAGAAVQPSCLRVALVNDTRDAWHATVVVQRMALDGTVLAQARERAVVPPNGVDSSVSIVDAVGAPTDVTRECIMVEVEDQRAWWLHCRDRALHAHPAQVRVEMRGAGRLWTARVTALTLVRDLWVEPLEPWVQCAPNLLTLLPGEVAEIRIELERPHAAPRGSWPLGRTSAAGPTTATGLTRTPEPATATEPTMTSLPSSRPGLSTPRVRVHAACGVQEVSSS